MWGGGEGRGSSVKQVWVTASQQAIELNVYQFPFRITEKNSIYSSKEILEEADFCGLKSKLSGFPVSRNW